MTVLPRPATLTLLGSTVLFLALASQAKFAGNLPRPTETEMTWKSAGMRDIEREYEELRDTCFNRPAEIPDHDIRPST